MYGKEGDNSKEKKQWGVIEKYKERMVKMKELEKELPIMTEEERLERQRQEFKYQQNLLELCRTFQLMGYEKSDIFEGLRSLRFEVSEDQTDFYCNFIEEHKSQSIREINADLWRFLWEIEPPEMPVEPEQEEKPYPREAVSSYMCQIVVLNLLIDRIDYLRSVLNAGCFKMTHFIDVGYDTKYVETMKRIIEENPEMHTRDIARRVYHELYVVAKHMCGFFYSIDKRDFWSLRDTCRREWKNRAKLIRGGQRDE